MDVSCRPTEGNCGNMEGGDFKLLLNSAIHDFVCCPTIFDKDLYHQRGVRVYKLLTVVNEFLEASQMMDRTHIILNYPEIGQVLCLLSQNAQVLSSPKIYASLMRSILWFHRPNSRHPIETKATQWAAALMRNTVVYPMRQLLSIAPGLERLGILISQEQLSEVVLATWKQDCDKKECLKCLDTICKDILVLLNTARVDQGRLFSFIDILPSENIIWCPNESRTIYQEFSKTLVRGDLNVPVELHISLSRKYAGHMENEVVKLFGQFAYGCQTYAKELESSWLIKTMAQNKELFSAAIQIINTLIKRMDFHFKALEFVHQVLNEIKKRISLVKVYPHHVATLVYILDMVPKDIMIFQNHHALTILKKVACAIRTGRLSATEALLLFCHFPKWWEPITVMAMSPDAKIKAEVLVFWKTFRNAIKEITSESYS